MQDKGARVHAVPQNHVNRRCTKQKIKTSAPRWRSVADDDLVGRHAATTKRDFRGEWTRRRAFLNAGDAPARVRVCVRGRVCVTWVERLTRAREGFLCRRETLSEIAVDNTTIQRAWHARRGFRRDREGPGGGRDTQGESGRGAAGGQRRRRGGFRADTEISPILEGWLATPLLARGRAAFIMRTRLHRGPRFSPLFTAATHNHLPPPLPTLFFLFITLAETSAQYLHAFENTGSSANLRDGSGFCWQPDESYRCPRSCIVLSVFAGSKDTSNVSLEAVR